MNSLKDRLKNVTMLMLCFLYFLVLGKANKKAKISLKSVLIFHSGKLGDLVCATPMFSAIKKTFPNCKVIVFGDKVNKELLSLNSDIDEYVVFEKNNLFSNMKKVRQFRVDFACNVTPSFANLASLYLAGIPVISTTEVVNGESPYETKTYKVLSNFVIKIPHQMGSYAPREYLKLLEPGRVFSDNTQKHLSFSKEAKAKVKQFFIQNNIMVEDFVVGISPSAGNKVKKWPVERFSKLADYIFHKYQANIIVIGGNNDRVEVEEMIDALDENTKVISALGQFNIDGLKALVSEMDMFVSVDTGPIYIAEAFGVPTIDITGPIDEKEQPPIGELHRVVHIKNRKKPQLFVMNARCYDLEEARRQTEEISVEMVTKEIDSLYNKLKND